MSIIEQHLRKWISESMCITAEKGDSTSLDIAYTIETSFEYYERKITITIYAKYPGLLIGYAGDNVKRLKRMLYDEALCGNVEIKFVRVDGFILSEDKEENKEK